MTYDAQKAVAGRKPIRMCALYLPYCRKDYGQSVTNLLLQSEDFSTTWTKSGVGLTSNADFAPDGDYTADIVNDDNAASTEGIYQNISSYSVSNNYVASIWLKKHSATHNCAIQVLFFGSTSEAATLIVDSVTGMYAVVNGGATSPGGGVEDLGDYWRIWVTGKSTDGSNTTGRVTFWPAFSDNFTGSDATVTGAATIWGGQAHVGTTLKHYVTTTTTTATGACTAALSAGNECYNTFPTCQDTANFDAIEKRYLFIEETTENLTGYDAIPCVKKVSSAHSKIDVDQGSTGQRAALSIECVDFPHHDRGVDPYVSTRSSVQGTIFQKLKARNRAYENKRIKLITGYLANGYDNANFKERSYFLEKFEGPKKDGTVQLVAMDIIQRLHDDRKTVPEITSGELTATLAAATTANFTVTGDADKYATGGGSVRINSEVISYSSGTDNGDGTFTFSTLTRGVDNTTAAQHAQDDVVQKCEYFNAQKPYDIAYALYVTHGGIPAHYIDTAQWTSVSDIWLQKTYTRRLTKPIGINQLLGEIHQQMGLYTWYDEEDAKIKLEAIRPPDYNTITTYKESETVRSGTLDSPEKPDLRKNEIWVHYNPKTSIEYEDDEDFQNAVVQTDESAKSSNEYGDVRFLQIHAAWIIGSASARQLSGRTLSYRRNVPRFIHFEADAKDENLKTGNQFYLEFDRGSVQKVDGSNETLLLLVIQRDEIKAGRVYAYRCRELFYSGRYAFISPASTPDYSSATLAQKNAYGFISSAGGGDFSDGGEAYKII